MDMRKEVLQAEPRNVLEYGVLDDGSIVLKPVRFVFGLLRRFVRPIVRLFTVLRSIVRPNGRISQIAVRIVVQRPTVRPVSQPVLSMKSIPLRRTQQIVAGEMQFAQTVLAIHVRIAFLITFYQFAGHLNRDALIIFAQTGKGTVDYAARQEAGWIDN